MFIMHAKHICTILTCNKCKCNIVTNNYDVNATNMAMDANIQEMATERPIDNKNTGMSSNDSTVLETVTDQAVPEATFGLEKTYFNSERSRPDTVIDDPL